MAKKKIENPIVFPNGTAFLPGVKSAVVFGSSKTMFEKPDSPPIQVTFKKKSLRAVVPWGESNDLPQQILSKAGKSPDLSTDLLFNISVGYGDGVVACRWEIDKDGKKKVVPVYDNEEINEFFEHNDINGYLLEQLTDLNYFYNIFPEVILNQENSASRKIVELNSKEATFSRWEEMNKDTGKIEHHYYSAKWTEGSPDQKDIDVTEVLDMKRPIPDILILRLHKCTIKGNSLVRPISAFSVL